MISDAYVATNSTMFVDCAGGPAAALSGKKNVYSTAQQSSSIVSVSVQMQRRPNRAWYRHNARTSSTATSTLSHLDSPVKRLRRQTQDFRLFEMSASSAWPLNYRKTLIVRIR